MRLMRALKTQDPGFLATANLQGQPYIQPPEAALLFLCGVRDVVKFSVLIEEDDALIGRDAFRRVTLTAFLEPV